MRILLAARQLCGIGGVQSWVRTVVAELVRRGHEVDAWAADADVPVGRFDIGVLAHGAETRQVFGFCDRTVLVSHGIISHERPVEGADVLVFVSEEVRQHWQDVPFGWLQTPSMHIVRQPIDTGFWRPGASEVADVYKPYVLRFSYYGGLPWLRKACEDAGYGLEHMDDVGPDDLQVARSWIRGAECVISSGRGALEAMACDRPTIICDDRPYSGGPLITPVGMEAASTNYSGRGGFEPTPELVAEQIRQALLGEWDWCGRVLAHHDVRNIVDELLAAAGVGVEACA